MYDIHVNQSSVTIPNWLKCLSQTQINALIDLPFHSEKIIACGYYPHESNLTFVTLDLKIYEFSPEAFYIPKGDFLPMSDGTKLHLPNHDGRWPKDIKGFYADSKWLINVSKLALQKPSLQLNNRYLGEFIIEDT